MLLYLIAKNKCSLWGHSCLPWSVAPSIPSIKPETDKKKKVYINKRQNNREIIVYPYCDYYTTFIINLVNLYILAKTSRYTTNKKVNYRLSDKCTNVYIIYVNVYIYLHFLIYTFDGRSWFLFERGMHLHFLEVLHWVRAIFVINNIKAKEIVTWWHITKSYFEVSFILLFVSVEVPFLVISC